MFSTPLRPFRINLPRVEFPLRLLCLLAGLAAVPAPAAPAETAPFPEFGPPPEWVVPTAWHAPEHVQENPGGEDYLLVDEQTRIAAAENYHHRVYQIVTDDGRQGGAQVYFYFDPSYQKLAIHHIRLVRDGEVSDRLDPAKIQVLQQERDLDSQLYNGERSALLILDDVRVGDIIDLAYTLRGTNPVFGGKFIDTSSLAWGVPVRDLRYRLLVPADRTVFSRTQGSAQALAGSKVLNGEQEQTWRRTDVPIVDRESNVPSSHIVYSYLDLSEYASWRDVVEWALPLYATNEAPQPLLDAVVGEIRGRAKTPEEQAVAALAFVQQQVRYLGIEMGPGSHRPSEPEEVLRRRFGDCKDKARLLTALFRRLGFEAAPALVHSSRREALHNRLPSPYAFDHVITALELAGQRYLLDPTLAYQRGDRLALRHIGRYGPYLRIASSSQTLEDAKLGTFDTGRTKIDQLFQVEKLTDPATFTVTSVAEGRAADNLRQHFATHTLEQTGREYLDYYTHYYAGITQVKAIDTADHPGDNTYTVTEHYRVKDLFAPNTTDKILRASFDAPTIWEYVRTPNLAQRSEPYAISHPTEVEEHVTINLPSDWKITPNNESVDDAAFGMRAVAENQGLRTVHLLYAWKSKAYRVEAARLPDFSVHAEQARKTLGYQLTWNTAVANAKATRQPATPTPESYPVNWPMAMLAAGLAAGGAAVIDRLVRKKNPVQPEPPIIGKATPDYVYQPGDKLEGLGGWLVLIGFGLVLRPIFILSTIVNAHRAYFNASVWNLLTTPGTDSYRDNYALVAPIELVYNLSLLAYCVLLLFLFFRRSYLFPRAMQCFLGYLVLGSIFVIWTNQALEQDVDEKGRIAGYTALFQVAIAAAIWIPYFQVSRRVKATFTR